MLDDDVTRFSLTTTPTQVKPQTGRRKLRELAPSSSEISLPAAANTPKKLSSNTHQPTTKPAQTAPKTAQKIFHTHTQAHSPF